MGRFDAGIVSDALVLLLTRGVLRYLAGIWTEASSTSPWLYCLRFRGEPREGESASSESEYATSAIKQGSRAAAMSEGFRRARF